MTLKTRNTLQLILIFLSLAVLVSFAIPVIILIVKDSISLPQNVQFPEHEHFEILNYSYYSIIASIFTIIFYSLTTITYSHFTFEKTQSNELLYFMLFIIGCLCESARLFFPILNLWQDNTMFTSIVSKTVIFGRACTVGSILFSSLFSSNEYRQYLGQNIAIAILASIFFAKIMPVNSMSTSPIGHMNWSFGNLLRIIQLVLFAIAILSLIVKEYVQDNKIKVPYQILIFYLGYLQLCDSYCWMNYGIGTAMLFTGTYLYLRNLHKIYMWNY